jgi:hypothetical protein
MIMKLSEVKNALNQVKDIYFELPNGQFVPTHFHITEVGYITKNFIDCGGTVREEKVANLQLWEANDFDHRLSPSKLKDIIELSENVLKIPNLDVEVEYQAGTIGKYGLEFDGNHFYLTQKQTACLAEDKCGIPAEKLKSNLRDLGGKTSCCSPGGGCC